MQFLQAFHADVREYNLKIFNVSATSISQYAASLYNSVYLYAHAATQLLAEGGTANDGQALMSLLVNISFNGIEQRLVDLDQNGDAIEPYFIMNYIIDSAQQCMKGVEVGNYDAHPLDLYVQKIQWPGTEE